MTVEMLTAGEAVGPPGVQSSQELRQRIAPIRPGRVVLRQQQSRGMGCQLPQRDTSNIAVRPQLVDIAGDRIIKRELAPATVRGRLAMLSSFGEWLVLRDRLPRNPIDQLTRPRLKDHLPRVPKWSFVEGLVSNGLGLREKAIVALLSASNGVAGRTTRSAITTSASRVMVSVPVRNERM